jgi:DNA-binding transcriptional ArsR family regulator
MEAAIKALAEPNRRRILELVASRELSAGEIAAEFEVTRPAVSQHLGVLREAGLIVERREGTKRLYRARPEGLVPLRAFLEGFWDGRLERLRLAAELEEGRRHSGSSPG